VGAGSSIVVVGPWCVFSSGAGDQGAVVVLMLAPSPLAGMHQLSPLRAVRGCLVPSPSPSPFPSLSSSSFPSLSSWPPFPLAVACSWPGARQHRRWLLTSAIHPASSCSQTWGQVLGHPSSLGCAVAILCWWR
jgi:hypothetical protein